MESWSCQYRFDDGGRDRFGVAGLVAREAVVKNMRVVVWEHIEHRVRAVGVEASRRGVAQHAVGP